MIVPALWLVLAASGSAAQSQRPAAVPEADAAYYFLIGRHLESQDKIPEAIEALKKAVALDPADAEPLAELSGLYARQDNATDSIASAEHALKIDPQNAEANRILGSVLAALIEQKQPLKPGDDLATYAPRAIAALEIAHKADPDDLGLGFTLAGLYLDNNRPADAIPLLQRVADEQPQYVQASLLLAEAQEASGHVDAAVGTLQTVLRDQPKLLRAQVQLAEVYERQQKWSTAADTWARAQALSPQNTQIAPRRAAALSKAGRPTDAIAVLQDALKQQPGDVRLSFMLAQAQHESGDLDSAEATARSLHAAHPDDTRATYLFAQILDARGRYQDEIDLVKPEIARLRAAPATADQAAMLLGSEGLALQQLHKDDEAIGVFKDALTLAPDDPLRYVLLIQGYSAANRHKEAIDEGELARQKFAGDSSVLYQLGEAYDRAGRKADAEQVFRGLIAHDPLDAPALNYLGYMFAEQGTSLDEAVSLIERALKVEPGNPSYLDSLGWAYLQEGKLDLADRPLTTAADKLPTNSAIQEHLGDLRLKQNRRADAIAAWQRALGGDGQDIDRAKIEKKIAAAQKRK